MVHTSAWIAGGVTGAVIVGAQLKGMLQRAAVNSTHWTLDNSDFTEQRASDLPPPTSATENAATFVTEPLQRREIPLAQTGVGALPPETIAQVLERAERRNGSAIALKVERDGKWKEWTYSQFAEDCRRFARFLLSPEVDLPRAASVCIMGFNSPEWVIAHIGTILAGGLSAGVYVTNGTEECKYIAEHCEARVVVADSMKQIEKFADAGSVTTRVVWDPALAGASTAAMSDDDSDAGVVTFSDALSVGDTVEETKLRARVAELCPEQACQLIYTSGTTGPPKGVMLSHDNATWTAKAMCQSVLQNFCTEHTEHLVSFLPFSHVAAQLADIYCALLMLPSHAPYAVTVWFARPDALKGSLVQTLRTARPTAFFGVPRVFEKMMTAMVDKAKDAPALVKSLAAWAKSVGCEADQATQGRLTTPTVPVSYLLANKLVFSKVKQALGFDRIKRVWSAAAPISKEVQLYFGSLGIVVGDVFGMSECTGPHCVSRLRARRHGSVGPPIDGVDTRIVHDSERGDREGEGELCLRGRHVFLGYLHDTQKSAESIDSEGWLHTGDLARADEDGFISITGRIKELIITAGGENVAPVPIEEHVLREAPALQNAVLVGDRRKFLSMLVVPRCAHYDPMEGCTQRDETDLSPLIADTEVSVASTTLAQAREDPAWRAYVQRAIDAYNEHAKSRAQRVQKFVILRDCFSVRGGHLTPTLKLKRKVVLRENAEAIETLYQ
ncbi:MAG: hypothetical protein MHM6MM_000402 [Cercozoa sp. M6MM]